MFVFNLDSSAAAELRIPHQLHQSSSSSSASIASAVNNNSSSNNNNIVFRSQFHKYNSQKQHGKLQLSELMQRQMFNYCVPQTESHDPNSTIFSTSCYPPPVDHCSFASQCLGNFINSGNSSSSSITSQMMCSDVNYKPPYSYITLVAMAIECSPQRRCSLSDIYSFIMDSFVYYRRPDIKRRWQNSVRHCLSFNDCFVNSTTTAGRGRGGDGKNSGRPARVGRGSGYWTLHQDARSMFTDGSTLRRLRRFKCKQSEEHRGHGRRKGHGRSGAVRELHDLARETKDIPLEAGSHSSMDIGRTDQLSPEVTGLRRSCPEKVDIANVACVENSLRPHEVDGKRSTIRDGGLCMNGGKPDMQQQCWFVESHVTSRGCSDKTSSLVNTMTTEHDEDTGVRNIKNVSRLQIIKKNSLAFSISSLIK